MRNQSSIKLLIIFLLGLLLMVPLTMVKYKLHERSSFKEQARHSVERSWTGAQTLLNPVIVIPYTIKPSQESGFVDKADGVELHKTLLLEPVFVNVDASVTTKYLAKGIYRIPVYSSDIRLNGTVLDSEQRGKVRSLLNAENLHEIGEPYVSIHISDVRGLEGEPELRWNAARLPLQPGSDLLNLGSGLHAELPELFELTDAVEFSLRVALRGTEKISFIPVAREATTKLVSTWPHPNFIGAQLPAERKIGPEGFQASWFTSKYAYNGVSMLSKCIDSGQCREMSLTSHGVSFIEPVNIYLQSERAIKYALLFVGLSFIAFFIFEHLKDTRIHPVQYSFVGLAIAVFYILLLSLAEHVTFAIAYLISAASCSALLLFYLRYVLHSMTAACVFFLMVTALYGVLYIIIQAEDYAFMMGAILVFLILATLMTVTRKIDWYGAEPTT